MPLLRRAGARSSRPRDVAAVRELPHRRPAQPDGAVLPAARLGLRARACWCSSRSTCRPRRSSREYAYFSSYSDTWVDHARSYADAMIERLRARRRTAWSSSWPATTATCCSTSSPGASRCSGIEPARNVAEVAAARGVRTLTEFFGDASWPTRLVAEGGPGRSAASATTCWPRCRTSTTSSPASQGAARPSGRGHHRVPAPAAPDRGATSSTRSTTSTSRTSRFGTVEADLRARTASSSFDVEELPTHGGSLRIYARHAEPRARPIAPRGRRAARAASAPRAATTSSPTRAFGQRVAATKRELLEFLIARQATRARRSSATARPARATRCSTTAASAPTSSTTRSTATRTSTGGSCPGTPHPDPPAGADLPRRGRTTS